MKNIFILTALSTLLFSTLGIAVAAENPNTKVFDDGLPVDSQASTANVLPYGASLFSGKFQSQRDDGLNPDYIIASGDKIKMHIWGLMEANEVVTVDASGKMYVPEIGAVKVAGVRVLSLYSYVGIDHSGTAPQFHWGYG